MKCQETLIFYEKKTQEFDIRTSEIEDTDCPYLNTYQIKRARNSQGVKPKVFRLFEDLDTVTYMYLDYYPGTSDYGVNCINKIKQLCYQLAFDLGYVQNENRTKNIDQQAKLSQQRKAEKAAQRATERNKAQEEQQPQKSVPKKPLIKHSEKVESAAPKKKVVVIKRKKTDEN